MSDINYVIAGCVKNDQRSQTVFYNTYQSKIRGYIIKKMGSDEYVDEILSMTFERAFAKMHLFNGTGSIEGWLLTIVRHCMYEVINKITKQKSTRTFYTEHVGYLAEVNEICFTDSTSEFHTNELVDSIKKILPKNEYAVFMAFYEGYSHREIAEKLNITEGTSKWYMFEARRKIHKKIASGDLVI